MRQAKWRQLRAERETRRAAAEAAQEVSQAARKALDAGVSVPAVARATRLPRSVVRRLARKRS